MAHRVREVLFAFLKLGVSAFGGPIAHLGYFREEFVLRRAWLDEKDYADLVALCQFLPGPASSQVGFALGLARAGPLGALAAWAAFTLPSALLLILFAYSASLFSGVWGGGAIAGLKIAAVAIVGQAVWGMARSLCPDRERAAIALAAVLIVVGLGAALGQVPAIAVGAVAGLVLCRAPLAPLSGHFDFQISRAWGALFLTLFALLLVTLPLAAAGIATQGLAVFDAFYRAGALVFGGGHVVLPLLEAEVVRSGWVSQSDFLAGYGAAQAVPGPLFTFAAYLGTVLNIGPGGLVGAAIALIAVFLPGFLLLAGIIPFWDALRQKAWAQAAMRGANAAVVGILGAALYDPIFTSAVKGSNDFALALICFVMLVSWKAPPWMVVIVAAAGGYTWLMHHHDHHSGRGAHHGHSHLGAGIHRGACDFETLGDHLHAEEGHASERGRGDERRILAAFFVIAIFFVVEVVGGLVSGSLALLADAGHMFSDAAALGFSWWALRIGRRQADARLSYGYRRYEILAAFVNGLALFAIAAWIVVEAARRFMEPVPIMGKTMLIVACAGLASNIVAFYILNGGNQENLNMRSAMLHVLGDLLGSAAAILAAIVIMFTNWTPIDPLLSVLVALIILRSAWHVVRASAHILLEGAPEGMTIADIKSDLEENVPGVYNAHHIHAWSITAEQHMLTLHIVPQKGCDGREVVRAVKARLVERFGVSHVTVEVNDDMYGETDRELRTVG